TIARFTKHFEVLLRGIVADPDCRISRLPILTAAERSVSQASSRAADETRLHELVTNTSDDLAVITPNGSITYAELDRRSTALAGQLRGDHPGVIAFLADRSIDAIVAVMAILKSGNAYLPIDPATPADRIAYLLKDAN